MIELIRAKIDSGQFEFSKHAADQSILRQITLQEIREAITSGQIIEDYPADKYGPSCLVLGYTKARRLSEKSRITENGESKTIRRNRKTC